MSLTSAQRTAYEIGAVIVLGLAAWGGIAHHYETVGAQALLLHAADSTAKVNARAAILAAQKALQDSVAAQKAVDAAHAQIAAQKALRAHSDSVAQESANARAQAEQVAKDSSASAQTLRAALEAVLAASARDSADRVAEHAGSDRTISGLLAALQADSVSLSAERARAASLDALQKSTAQKVALLEKAQPSAFGQFVKLAAVGLVAIEGGRISAGRIP